MQGGIDLSVGSVAAVGGMAAAYFLQLTNSPAIAIICAILVGLAFGFFNGIIHVRAKVPSFLVTLGSLYIGRGIVIIWSKGASIQITKDTMIGYIGSLPYIVIIMAAILLIAFVILKYTSFGRYVQALGDNEAAAKFVGINVNRVKLFIFVISSLLAAIGGLVLSSRIGAATPRTGEQMELEAIAAVVLGGTPLTGGVGGVERTLLGVVLLVVLTNGLILLGIPSDVQFVIKGLVLIIAVAASLDRERIGIIK
jgi:ribose/xylose/arabinose/galactoside ABC-type transport system permease subunit